jgi:hypothetical protein
MLEIHFVLEIYYILYCVQIVSARRDNIAMATNCPLEPRMLFIYKIFLTRLSDCCIGIPYVSDLLKDAVLKALKVQNIHPVGPLVKIAHFLLVDPKANTLPEGKKLKNFIVGALVKAHSDSLAKETINEDQKYHNAFSLQFNKKVSYITVFIGVTV